MELGLNVKPEIMKLEKKIGSKSSWPSILAMIYWIWFQQQRQQKQNKQVDYIKLKPSDTTKEIINKMKKQPTEREKNICKSRI